MSLGRAITQTWRAARERVELSRDGRTWKVTAGTFDSALGYARARLGEPVVLARKDRNWLWPRVILTVTTDPLLVAAAPPVASFALPVQEKKRLHDFARPGAPPSELELGRSRLGFVLAIVGVGLLMVAAGDALGRTSREQSLVVPLFLAGLSFIVGPCAWRLTGTAATRTERLWVSVILGLGLLAAYVFRSPLIFDNADELAHGATLVRLLDNGALFQPNPVLPISAFYPGIELVTVATRWLTGLPVLLDQMVVLALARTVLVLCVFLIVERACRSARAGGIGVLVYVASPEFYSLSAQYGYQTIALAFAVAAVYLIFVSIDAAPPRRGRLFGLALVSIGGMVVSHHVTSWIVVGFLVVWAASLRLAAGGPGRKKQARIVGLAALAGIVFAGSWFALLGHVLTGYVNPMIQAATTGATSMLERLHGDRKLFTDSAGGGSPLWEEALIVAAAVLYCVIILASLYAVFRNRSVRGGRLRYLPAAVAATYPLAILSNLSSEAKVVGARTQTFIFFGVAVVVGGWLAGRLMMQRRVIERMATVGVAVVCFLGSTLYGGGPLPILVNGPYIVGAHERSVGSPSLAMANWVTAHLPVGSHVAADRDNAGLLNEFGQVDAANTVSPTENPARLFFDHKLTPSDISLIRKQNIRYVVTDTRLTEDLPLFGAYIAPGETEQPTRLTTGELEKFNSTPGVHRIYDNGAIQVYDLSRLLGKRPLVAPSHHVRTLRGAGTDLVVLVLALLVATVWLLRLRRRIRLARIDEHTVVCGMVGALAVGLFGTFAILLVHLPAEPLAILSLLALLALGLRPGRWWLNLGRQRGRALWSVPVRPTTESRPAAPATDVSGTEMAPRGPRPEPAQPPGRARRARSQLVLACVGLTLSAVGASVAVAAAQKEWVPPPELSIEVGPGQVGGPVVSVDLGAAAPISAHLAVTRRGRVLLSVPLSSSSGTQNVVLPADVLQPGTVVRLVAGARTIRNVYG